MKKMLRFVFLLLLVMGIAAGVFLGAELKPGIDIVLSAVEKRVRRQLLTELLEWLTDNGQPTQGIPGMHVLWL